MKCTALFHVAFGGRNSSTPTDPPVSATVKWSGPFAAMEVSKCPSHTQRRIRTTLLRVLNVCVVSDLSTHGLFAINIKARIMRLTNCRLILAVQVLRKLYAS